MEDTSRIKGLKILIIGLVLSAIFIGVPVYRVHTHAEKFLILRGLFSISCWCVPMGLAMLVGGRWAADFVYNEEGNNYTWKQAIGMVVLASLSIGAYIKFEFIVAALGYVHKLWGQ